VRPGRDPAAAGTRPRAGTGKRQGHGETTATAVPRPQPAPGPTRPAPRPRLRRARGSPAQLRWPTRAKPAPVADAVPSQPPVPTTDAASACSVRPPNDPAPRAHHASAHHAGGHHGGRRLSRAAQALEALCERDVLRLRFSRASGRDIGDAIPAAAARFLIGGAVANGSGFSPAPAARPRPRRLPAGGHTAPSPAPEAPRRRLRRAPAPTMSGYTFAERSSTGPRALGAGPRRSGPTISGRRRLGANDEAGGLQPASRRRPTPTWDGPRATWSSPAQPRKRQRLQQRPAEDPRASSASRGRPTSARQQSSWTPKPGLAWPAFWMLGAGHRHGPPGRSCGEDRPDGGLRRLVDELHGARSRAPRAVPTS